MRYINKLQAENEVLQHTLSIVEEELTQLLSYLSSPKFQGELNNYVNSDEMFQRIMEIRGMMQNELA